MDLIWGQSIKCDSKEEAAEQYNIAAKALFGKEARLNELGGVLWP